MKISFVVKNAKREELKRVAYENWSTPLPAIGESIGFENGTLVRVVDVEWILSEDGLKSVSVMCE